MERYYQLFKHLSIKKEGLFLPFVMLGDPYIELSLAIIDALVESGADALELGMPFSDPVADGPTIQRATLRALSAGTTISYCFEMLKIIRQKYTDLPIGLLMYANLILSRGIYDFYLQCADIGLDSVLIVDIPIEESEPFRQVAMNNNIAPIFICPPNANNHLLYEIALYGRGYTYVLSRNGTTGTEDDTILPLKNLIYKLHKYHAAPPLQGFGISKPSQIKKAIELGALGVISGSAIVKIIESNKNNKNELLSELKKFVRTMKNATINIL
ncbi:tryptophan synthase subunit alpha [Pantoea sp. Aalb]|uniref:tryptophan synthase subunit alpha n=1 Tax=Pantoea sp. Aalb TaxID=2576762 RepID=UPI001324BFEE|nr:tryptophan synthase subunit alpha [Pantoea sp. Aalb]MXP67389.1 tryptophan synthase subunit alpha [Pantoea sp. Aalb]